MVVGRVGRLLQVELDPAVEADHSVVPDLTDKDSLKPGAVQGLVLRGPVIQAEPHLPQLLLEGRRVRARQAWGKQ